MFIRSHHQDIAEIINEMRSDALMDKSCYFAGGTSISMRLGEYRESVDINFLASRNSYRDIRRMVTDHGLDSLLGQTTKILAGPNLSMYGIRAVIKGRGIPVKFEIISVYVLDLHGTIEPASGLNVPLLSFDDLTVCKLQANADRALDASTASRDAIDLAFIWKHRGFSRSAWDKATTNSGYTEAYLRRGMDAARKRLSNLAVLNACLDEMRMNRESLSVIAEQLQINPAHGHVDDLPAFVVPPGPGASTPAP